MDDAAGLEYRIWTPRALAPSASETLDEAGIVLGRELLGASDNRLSRRASAPTVVPEREISIRIRVPEGARVAPIVIGGFRLDDFQVNVPPATSKWKIAPGEIGRPERVVSTESFSLAILRALEWDRDHELHFLFKLPALAHVAPGAEAVFATPVTIVLGEAAVEFVATSTWAPETGARGPLASLDVAPLRTLLLNPGLLDRVASPPLAGTFSLPRMEKQVSWSEVPDAIESTLGANMHGWGLVPAVREPADCVLLLAYEDGRGSWRALGTAHDPTAWLAGLIDDIDGAEHAPAAVGAAQALPVTPAPHVAPASEALASPRRFGAFVTRDRATAAVVQRLESAAASSLGPDRERAVDVRVIAATSRDIDALIGAERFRSDLYYRIAQLAVRVPPLRARPVDIVPLAETFLQGAAPPPGQRLTDEARTVLSAQSWPGNVRELKNAVERAVALAGSSGNIQPSDLAAPGAGEVRDYGSRPAVTTPDARGSAPSLLFSEAVRALAVRALREDRLPAPSERSQLEAARLVRDARHGGSAPHAARDARRAPVGRVVVPPKSQDRERSGQNY